MSHIWSLAKINNKRIVLNNCMSSGDHWLFYFYLFNISSTHYNVFGLEKYFLWYFWRLAFYVSKISYLSTKIKTSYPQTSAWPKRAQMDGRSGSTRTGRRTRWMWTVAIQQRTWRRWPRALEVMEWSKWKCTSKRSVLHWLFCDLTITFVALGAWR